MVRPGQPAGPIFPPVANLSQEFKLRMSWATALLGDTLLVKDGDKVVKRKTEEVVKAAEFIGESLVSVAASLAWPGKGPAINSALTLPRSRMRGPMAIT